MWLFWSKATNCCQEVRAMLGCSPLTTEPCLGYEGDCSLLPEQFMGIEGIDMPEDYTCHQARRQ